MSETSQPDELSANILKAMQISQELTTEYFRQAPQATATAMASPDPLHIGDAFSHLLQRFVQNPSQVIDAQNKLWMDHMRLWQSFSQRAMGEDVAPFIEPDKGDKRFKDQDWTSNEMFDLIKQSYLLTSRWLQDTVSEVQGIEPQTQKKIEFYTKQMTDAFAPTNFAFTNPEVLRAIYENNGENLVRGFENLRTDLERGHGKLAVRQTDMDHFEVGRNLATTPGKVIFQNEIMQLIQFSPSTDEVHKVPLLIFPPWINKYYILDLGEVSSFIKHFISKGYTIFITSWVNPEKELSEYSFEDYLHKGVFAALDAVEQATGEQQVNTIGYCIGGTLLGCALAYMAAKNDNRISAATFFTAQLDFEEAGDLKVFVDEDQLQELETRMDAAGGVLDASDMAQTFNMLRANDLIWSFVINNYLLGKDPIPFDLLFWNADSTRMPKALHLYYLRNFYLENKLSKGELELDGVRLDMKSVTIPVFLQSARQDHIAPYPSVWRTSKLFGGDDTTFMIAGSGHIAGVVNPPAKNKYQYWLNDKEAATLDEWWAGAEEHPGSWWPHWEANWLADKSGPMVPARVPGEGKLDVIEDAPGSYVKQRA